MIRRPPKIEAYPLPELWLPGRQKAAPMDSRRFLQRMGCPKDCGCGGDECQWPPYTGTCPTYLQVDVEGTVAGDTCTDAECAAMDGTYTVERVTSWDSSVIGDISDYVFYACSPRIMWRLTGINTLLCTGFSNHYFRELWVILQCCNGHAVYDDRYGFLVYYYENSAYPIPLITTSFAALPGRPNFDAFTSVTADPVSDDDSPAETLINGYCADCTATITIP